jgi:hypothetical protein
MYSYIAQFVLLVATLDSLLAKQNLNAIDLQASADFVDFTNAVTKFCSGKPEKNFCSKEHLSIMHHIESMRIKKLQEEKNHLKRIIKRISKIVFKLM